MKRSLLFISVLAVLALSPSILIGVVILIGLFVVVLLVLRRRRVRQHGLPRAIRRVGVFLSRLLMRLETLMTKHHNSVLVVYAVVFVAYFTGFPVLQQIGHFGKVIVYCFYGVAMLNLFMLFIAHRLLDPVPKTANIDDAAAPLDPTKVTLVSPNTQETFNQLVRLGEEAFAAWGGSAEDRVVVYKKFFEANSNSFKLVVRHDVAEPIGFSCILPVRESAFRQFRLGILDSWDFARDDILSTSQYLCLNAIYIRRLSQNEHTRGVRIICSHMSIFIHSSADGSLPILVADGLTLEGRRFLKRYGFESSHRTKDETPIYELDLSRPGILSDRAMNFMSCLRETLKASATWTPSDEEGPFHIGPVPRP